MAKKQTRRSISVSGDTYNAARDYCDEHGLSTSGLVTDLLSKYLEEHADGPDTEEEEEEEEQEDAANGEDVELGASIRGTSRIQRSPVPTRLRRPQAAGDLTYPDRRGPGFTPLPEGKNMARWLVTAEIEVFRKRQIDAQTAVETLLSNLIHRRMINDAQVIAIDLVEED